MKKMNSVLTYLATHSKLKYAIGITAFVLLAALMLMLGDGHFMEAGLTQSWPPPLVW